MAGVSRQVRGKVILPDCTVLFGVYVTRRGKTYSGLIEPLRKLVIKNVRFKWTQECKDDFAELKRLLTAHAVMANFKSNKRTRLYVDHGPTGVASTLAQEHTI